MPSPEDRTGFFRINIRELKRVEQGSVREPDEATDEKRPRFRASMASVGWLLSFNIWANHLGSRRQVILLDLGYQQAVGIFVGAFHIADAYSKLARSHLRPRPSCVSDPFAQNLRGSIIRACKKSSRWMFFINFRPPPSRDCERLCRAEGRELRKCLACQIRVWLKP